MNKEGKTLLSNTHMNVIITRKSIFGDSTFEVPARMEVKLGESLMAAAKRHGIPAIAVRVG